MSRWHKKDCWAPAVVLRNLQPACKSCGGVFSLETLIASQQCGQRSFEKLPPDEKQGELNLWWPPSVKYVNRKEPHQHNNDKSEPKQNQPREDDKTMPQPESTFSAFRNEIYGKPLPQGSFRLICMQSVKEPSEPVHVELETYRHSHCPSYETVSYAWGGEQGDSSPCRPIFIGPYWDVLLQTENCWQMLRYARPTRGIRLLWVDAICINQDNDEERSAQVAMMAQIYNDCEKTLVYLGPEIVKWHGEHLPERKGLHELAAGGQSGRHSRTEEHRKLLESRKYFTRLWIIQELILSPKLIIPIDNVDYWADHTTDSRVQAASGGAWDWWNNTVPWAKSMGKRELPVQNASEALLLTTQNRSSDPRDRLFGVLALLGLDISTSPPLRANYTISNQHVWMGFFSNAIANDGALWVFHNSSGHRAVSSMPSWAPDWNLHRTWSGFSRHVLSETDKREFPRQLYGKGVDSFTLPKDDVLHRHYWKQHISVDAASGALIGVHAMRLFTFVEKPKCLGTSASGDSLVFRAENTHYFALISTERLDDLVQPLTDHLYLLRTDSETIFLVLRGHNPATLKVMDGLPYLLGYTPGARRCRLIASCTSLPLFTGHIWNELECKDLQDHISQLRHHLSEELGSSGLLFPLARDRWGILPLYWAIDGEGCLPVNQYSAGNLPEAYLACLPAGYHQCAEQSYLTLTAIDGSDATIQGANDWLTSVLTMLFNQQKIMPEEYIEWEWSFDNTRWTKFADWDYTVDHRYSNWASSGVTPGTWKFNPIPCSQISGAAAGAVLDHGPTIPKSDGVVRLRAPTQSILKFIERIRFIREIFNRHIYVWLRELAEYMNLRSVEEVRDVLLDTNRDWSHLKFQEKTLSYKDYEGVALPTVWQLIDIF